MPVEAMKTTPPKAGVFSRLIFRLRGSDRREVAREGALRDDPDATIMATFRVSRKTTI